MAVLRLRNEEIIGLGAAAFLHVALFGVLLLQPERGGDVYAPQRVTVSLAEDVGLEATAPEIVTESRASMAPVVSDIPLPPEVERNEPTPREEARPQPRQSPTAQRKPPKKTPAKPQQAQKKPPKSDNRSAQGGASKQFENAFDGAGSSADTNDTRPPASQVGRQAKASLLQSIARQLGRHWDAPEGAEAEKLSLEVDWRLNEDGSLAGAPKCRSVQGVTPSNRPQANVYCRYAIAAIRRAAPFSLPDRYYNVWKSVRRFKFSGAL